MARPNLTGRSCGRPHMSHDELHDEPVPELHADDTTLRKSKTNFKLDHLHFRHLRDTVIDGNGNGESDFQIIGRSRS